MYTIDDHKSEFGPEHKIDLESEKSDLDPGDNPQDRIGNNQEVSLGWGKETITEVNLKKTYLLDIEEKADNGFCIYIE